MEMTKSCVRVLKFERKLWKVIWYPFKFLISLGKWFNWCIIRSLLRIFTIPFICVIIWVISNITQSPPPKQPVVTNLWELAAVLAISITLILLVAGIAKAWLDVPEREQKILNGVEE